MGEISSTKRLARRNFEIGLLLKFIYSEEATNVCEISTVDLSYVAPVKSTVDILQNFVAFSEYMNFKRQYNLPFLSRDLNSGFSNKTRFTTGKSW